MAGAGVRPRVGQARLRRHVPLEGRRQRGADAGAGRSVTRQVRSRPSAAASPSWPTCAAGSTDTPKLGHRTRERYNGLLKHHIAPHIGEARLGDLTTASVRRWHATMHTVASSDTAAKAYRLLRAVCNTAVEDSVLAVNPCRSRAPAWSTMTNAPQPPSSPWRPTSWQSPTGSARAATGSRVDGPPCCGGLQQCMTACALSVT
jgi:hypothetical protein